MDFTIVETQPEQPAVQEPAVQTLKKAGWDIDPISKAGEGKIIIYPRDDKNVRLDKFLVAGETPENEIKARLQARGWDASNFTKKF